METQDTFREMLVIELASVLAGPAVGMFFAELGATVIKVENHKQGGDVTRSWKVENESAHTTVSSYFSSVNWGKESIGVDLSTAEGKEIVYALVKRADLVISSFKPGDAEKLAMDFETLQQMNPGLIYASLSAYGSLDSRTGFDAIIQGESGFMQMNGTAASGPLKMPVALIDILAAHQLKEAVLVAMIKKMRTGKGSEVSTTLLGSGVASLANQATQFLVAGKIPARLGSGHPNIVPYGSTYRCADGKLIVIAAGNDKQFSALCACIGQPELTIHPDYAHNPSRVKNRQALESILVAAIEQLESETLLSRMREKQVPAGVVLNMQEVFEQPEAQKQLFRNAEIKGLRTVAFEGAGNEALALHPPPELGAATSRVLNHWLHLNETEIAALQQKGVIL